MWLKADLRMFQRRYGEAVELVDRAIALLEPTSAWRRLAEALILKASICGYMAAYDASVSHLQRALRLLDGRARRLRLMAYHALAVGYARTGNYGEAAVQLRRAWELCTAREDAVVRLQLLWVEGLVREGEGQDEAAERCFREAYGGFSGLGETAYRAVVGIDLAILLTRQGRTSEAARLATEAIPTFEALPIPREAVAAFKLLHEAVAAGEVSLAILRQVREHLELLQNDPTVQLAAVQ